MSTKLAAEVKNYGDAVAAIDGSLTTLGLDHIDLMMIHSPQPWNDFRGGDYADGNREAWRALEDAHRTGKIRAIGVSNFEQRDVENILQSSTVTPHVNQLVVHAGNTPAELLAYCQDQDILVEAYSPIAHGEILKNPDIAVMAERYEVAVPQLRIRYTLQLSTVSLPKTANPEHMRSNAEVDFVISDDDMIVLADCGPGLRRAQRIPRLQRQNSAITGKASGRLADSHVRRLLASWPPPPERFRRAGRPHPTTEVSAR